MTLLELDSKKRIALPSLFEQTVSMIEFLLEYSKYMPPRYRLLETSHPVISL